MFLYFLPGHQAHVGDVDQLPAVAKAAGLGSVLSGAGVGCRGVSGPGGTGMLVWSAAKEPKSSRYDAGSQRWEPVNGPDGAPLYWVGMENGGDFSPAALQRATTVPGNEAAPTVRLLDGADWLVPCLGFSHEGEIRLTRLPSVYRMAAGKREKSVRAEWRELFAAANQAAQLVYFGGSMPFDAAYEFAAKTLGVNYRVGPVECAMLELLGDDELMETMRHAVGQPDLAAKKNAEPPSAG